ncbi:pseudouridine synthase [Dysgonomonas sp. HDW5A]|uniref:pseudouridine synthase n=1 Tax=unclassified Dysgonomonas TaxID=2630389 RepID=UPI0014090237|nr:MULTISPECIES: pseudouridine synthase [unclassified Dysgonomonas]QIK54630.1 pseudouridine synthase [Dysgonomonas sp. HDW5B]QIK60057.1 pseudouridine synthase [Dysgonomonas sp. HDW5A]
MITDRDNESRDGYSSSNKPSLNKNNQSEAKKKRPRVGDTRPVINRDNNSDDRRSNYNNDDRRSNYNSGERRSNYSDDRRSNYNSDDRRSYNNDDRRSNYNSGERRSNYNSDDRRGGGSYRPNNQSRDNNRRPYDRDQRSGGSDQNRSKGPKQLFKPVKYKENLDPETPIRLNKYLANAGVCSRREADSFITAGVVRVNGELISELGAKVKRGDSVTFQDKPVRLESKVYVLLNKPKNTVTTSDDPQNRKTVMDLVKGACPERIYPVGRLDRNTTGVLLLTNDGDLASKLMHPKYVKKKIYQVKLDREVAIEDMQAIADGIMLDDGEIHADSIAYVGEDVLDEVGIEIHSGRNRIVRRIFEKLGYQVLKLDRVYFAGLTKKNVTRGRWRYLTESEVNMLRMGAFE